MNLKKRLQLLNLQSLNSDRTLTRCIFHTLIIKRLKCFHPWHQMGLQPIDLLNLHHPSSLLLKQRDFISTHIRFQIPSSELLKNRTWTAVVSRKKWKYWCSGCPDFEEEGCSNGTRSLRVVFWRTTCLDFDSARLTATRRAP